MRVFAPTGDSQRGLGTNHASIEPGLLVFHQLNDRVVLAGELRHSFYLGYGRALSGHVWYEDLARFEYRMTF